MRLVWEWFIYEIISSEIALKGKIFTYRKNGSKYPYEISRLEKAIGKAKMIERFNIMFVVKR